MFIGPVIKKPQVQIFLEGIPSSNGDHVSICDSGKQMPLGWWQDWASMLDTVNVQIMLVQIIFLFRTVCKTFIYMLHVTCRLDLFIYIYILVEPAYT